MDESTLVLGRHLQSEYRTQHVGNFLGRDLELLRRLAGSISGQGLILQASAHLAAVARNDDVPSEGGLGLVGGQKVLVGEIGPVEGFLGELNEIEPAVRATKLQ